MEAREVEVEAELVNQLWSELEQGPQPTKKKRLSPTFGKDNDDESKGQSEKKPSWKRATLRLSQAVDPNSAPGLIASTRRGTFGMGFAPKLEVEETQDGKHSPKENKPEVKLDENTELKPNPSSTKDEEVEKKEVEKEEVKKEEVNVNQNSKDEPDFKSNQKKEEKKEEKEEDHKPQVEKDDEEDDDADSSTSSDGVACGEYFLVSESQGRRQRIKLSRSKKLKNFITIEPLDLTPNSFLTKIPAVEHFIIYFDDEPHLQQNDSTSIQIQVNNIIINKDPDYVLHPGDEILVNQNKFVLHFEPFHLSGFLLKQSPAFHKQWQRRYCVLKKVKGGGCLCYYKNVQQQLSDQPCGSIPLTRVAELKRVAGMGFTMKISEKSKEAQSESVETAQENAEGDEMLEDERVFCFIADQPEERDAWCDKIDELLTQLDRNKRKCENSINSG